MSRQLRYQWESPEIFYPVEPDAYPWPRCFPLPFAAGAAIGIAGAAVSCRPRRDCSPRRGCSPHWNWGWGWGGSCPPIFYGCFPI